MERKKPVFAHFYTFFHRCIREKGKKNMPSIRMDFGLWKESCHGEKKIYFYQHHIVYYPD